MEKKRKIKDLTLAELEEFLVSEGEKKFRAKQIFNWIYTNQISDFNEMNNVSKSIREILSTNFIIETLDIVGSQGSSINETKKYLFETEDKKKIESVIIPDRNRNTICISTQVGCPLDCKFCATGLMGYTRNLTTGEIVDQYLNASRNYGKDKITNIVYMGMGEPLLNYDNTVKSIESITSEFNNNFSTKRITVSTSGIPKRIYDLADTGLNVKLALSLHSCFEDIRDKIMPINIKYNLEENIEALKYYSKVTNSQVTFEYTMLKGVNDRKEDIKALGHLCSQIHSKINIIPFNSIAHMDPNGYSGTLEPTATEDIIDFVEALRNKNITVMLRDTQGDDIAAACGQLAIKG